MTTINCQYVGKCLSCPFKCDSCANNSAIEDHYQPRNPLPYYPWYPYTYPYIWCGDTNSTCGGTLTIYMSQTSNDFYKAKET